MKISILEKTLEYDNSRDFIDTLFREIDQLINDSDSFLSYLEVDGEEVYDDFYNYFVDHIHTIQNVKVVTNTLTQLTREILLSTMEYLKRAIPEINSLSESFYRTPTKEAWSNLATFFEGVKWIIDTYTMMDGNREILVAMQGYETWNLYSKDIYSLQTFVKGLEEALTSEDYITIADILSYEITSLFKDMLDKLTLLNGMDQGVSEHDIN